MQILQGIPVSPGVAIGETLVLDSEGFGISRRFVAPDAVDYEVARLNEALEAVEWEIDQNRQAVSRELGKQYGAIFAAHLQIVRDLKLRDEIESLVRQRNYSPEFAVARTLGHYAKTFQALENARLAERVDDIRDIENRLLRNLLGECREKLPALTSPVIVLAHTLTPSETANLDPNMVLAFATELGGQGSHTAIVAEARGIPAVVGAGKFLADVAGGETAIIDGDTGCVVLQPDEEILRRYRSEAEEIRTLAAHLESLRDLPAETTDGTPVHLLANIEFPAEVDLCHRHGATGIGLYRTEFLYLLSDVQPDEQTQFQAYAGVAQQMEGRPVIIRTQDLGADKMQGSPSREERNPFLGLRSIRLSLRNLPVFRTQLRAILRASALGDVRAMFPLISTVPELRQAKEVLSEAMDDLEAEGIEYNRGIPVGMMVELPATVLMLDHFLPEIDYISIGTNDLIQYALAVDRNNKEVAGLYNAADPAVLRLIEMSVAAANRRGIEVSLCGQMSGNPIYTMLLLGLGLRHLSVPPGSIPEIKRICRSVSIPQCEAVARQALAMESGTQIKTMLKEQLREVAPELA